MTVACRLTCVRDWALQSPKPTVVSVLMKGVCASQTIPKPPWPRSQVCAQLREWRIQWLTTAADDDASLSERGQREAVNAGRWLSGRGLRPDHVLCSAAVRAVQLAEQRAAAVRPEA